MHRMTGSYAVDRMRGFIQELHISYACGLLTFTVRRNPRPNAADADPNSYLQDLSDFALTVEGQDRARGRMIARPEPEPGEDDGRPISDLILRQVATAITDQYAPDEIAEFLERRASRPSTCNSPSTPLSGPSTLSWPQSGGGAPRPPGRAPVPRPLAGQSAADRAGRGPAGQLLDQLARQGWRVRADDSMLVTAEPVRGIPISAAFLRSTRLHALIEAEARDQFLNNKPDLGVFASMRAIEVRVRKLAGYGDEMIGVDMMNQPSGRADRSPTPRPPRANRRRPGPCSRALTGCCATPPGAGWSPSGISTATTGARGRSSSSTAATSPTNAKLCCNGNEYAKQMAARAGIGFTALDNGFAACDDVAAVQQICDSFDEQVIEALAARWLDILPTTRPGTGMRSPSCRPSSPHPGPRHAGSRADLL